ncbi:galectin-4 [Leptinotarsa decemlineata]|uniref:galectin-4 n=1 Tax=Leptinotarsa decemlineata TaxID=7539 RepID=UPI003D307CFA
MSQEPLIRQSIFPQTVKNLPEQLKTGMCIIINGFLDINCAKFVVDLVCDRSPKSDIALHIKPVLSRRYIVRNCRIGGQWGEEELTSMQKFSLERNKKFVMDILLAEKEFLVAINGNHFCGFIYRIPLSFVKVIKINGNLSINNIQYEMIDIYPRPSTRPDPIQLMLGGVIESPSSSSSPMRTPLAAVLPQGFPNDSELQINGYIKIVSRTFFINLQNGIHTWPHPDVHFHLKSISSPAFDNQTFFYNTRSNGVWGRQERANIYRFTPATNFNVVIQRLKDRYSIKVDDQLLGEFKFREKVDKINTLYIQGEIYINSVYMRSIFQ